MATKGVCLLVATDDITCRRIVDKMLQRCTYEVLHVGRATTGLKAIWEAKDNINLVLTNVHRLEEKGQEILDNIQKMFDSPVIFMSPDNILIRSKAKDIKVAAYVLKLGGVRDINELWESAMAAEEAGKLEINSDSTARVPSKARDANNEETKSTSATKEDKQTHEKRKRKETEEKSEQEETSGDDSLMEKKPRMVWSKEMHQKFLEAIEMLGPDKAFPKKIVEVMNMPGLTRENVASHLQKYRMCLRRAQEDSGSNYGMHLTNHARGSCFLSNHSLLSFNASERYSSVLNGLSFQHSPTGINSTASRLSVTPRLSTSLPNLTPAHLLAGSNQETLQQLSYPNLSPTDAVSLNSNHVHLAEEQHPSPSSSLLHEPNSITINPVNSGFRLYGDQKENILSTIEGEKSPSTKSDFCFIGLRLTDNGKSVEFGQSSISGNNNISEEMVHSSVGTLGTESLESVYHSTSTSYIPALTDALLQKDTYPDELPDCYPSSSICHASQQQSYTSLLGVQMEENSINGPSTLADSTPHEDLHLPHSCNIGYKEAFPSPLPHISVKNSINFTSVQHSTLPLLCNPIPASCNPQVQSSVQSSGYGCTDQLPEEEMYFPLIEAPGNEISAQDPTTSNEQIQLQESQMLQDLNFIKLLNEAGISSNQLFWEEHFNDTIFNH